MCSESEDRVNHRFTSAPLTALGLRDPTRPSLWSMANGRAWKQRLFTEGSRQPNKNVSTLAHSLNGHPLHSKGVKQRLREAGGRTTLASDT